MPPSKCFHAILCANITQSIIDIVIDEPSTHHEVSDNYTATLPTSWSVSELFPQTGHNLLFSYAVTLTKKGITVPITQKSVLSTRKENYAITSTDTSST